MTKVCNTCKEDLPLDRFYKNKTSRDGYQHHCKDCTRVKQAEWRKANPEKARSYMKKYRESERGRRARQARTERDREANRWGHIQRRYGLTQDDYTRMYEEQGSRCPLCLEEQEILYVDHCHQTGRVRGLVCDRCNRALGALRDDADIAERAAAYLRRAKF